MNDVVIYGTPGSPYTRSAILGLEEKRVPYRLVPVAYGQHDRGEHLGRHPFGRVPVLEHGNFRLYETQAILRYLDAVFPEPRLVPAEPERAARMNQLIGIVDWYFFQDVTRTLTWQRLVVPMHGGTPDEAIVAAARPKAEICLAEIARLMGDGPYLAGAALSLADLMLAPQLAAFRMTAEGRDMLKKHPSLQTWLALVESRPSMRQSMPRAA